MLKIAFGPTVRGRMRGILFSAALPALLLVLPAETAKRTPWPTTKIQIDQVGYLSGAAKIATVSAPGESFEVRRESDDSTVLRGKLSVAAKDAESGEIIQAADFSSLRLPGTYYLVVPTVGRSWKFSIGPSVYSPTFYHAMRAFYGQRCGMAVDLGPEFAGYSHAACHLKGAFHASSGREGQRDNAGGWHDAGDYGRYIVNSGITTGTLLWAWELFEPNLTGIKLNIPESGNGTPDFLNEIRWNLEWMLRMQDSDGGVWHKQTSANFSGFVMPEEDSMESLVIGTGRAPYKSTCATGDLAAVAAIAARVYEPYDKKLAARSLEAARAAWKWIDRYPNVTFKNPAGISTGEYGDNDCGDERLWAAAELWRTTGDPDYNQYFVRNYQRYLSTLSHPEPESWRVVAPMGLWAYALGKRPQTDNRVAAEIRAAALAGARETANRTRTSPYRIAMTDKDFAWGSNGQVGNYGVQLLVANALSPDKAFVESALESMHYLLGRNTFSLSWVTQVGANPYRHPHHRPSGGDKLGEPWPGLLSGGPNAARQDPVTQALPAGLPPAKVYSDDQDSYASNEVCINWQAMLVFMLAGVMK